MPVLADNYTCTGCMGCMNICPKNAIGRIRYSDGHYGISVDMEKCIECGACEKKCPVVNGSDYGCNNLESKFYAGWSADKQIRRQGATSGIFGALAKHFLTQGVYIAGAVMDGLECRYILTDDPAYLPELQGSKYTSSQPGYIFKEILSVLAKGKQVLFCGLPCHAAALISFIPERLRPALIVADIICGGVSSPDLIRRYAEAHEDMKSIVSFRDKSKGWKPVGYRYSLRYIDAEDKLVDASEHGRNLITDGFACELTDRYSCYDCRFAYMRRKSDLTLGDLWGDTLFPEEHSNGVSAIIVHTDKGEKILRESGVELHDVEPGRVLRRNSRIFNGKSVKKYFPERRMLGRLMKDLKYSSLMKIYASDLRNAGLGWMPFAAYRVVSFRIADMIKQVRDRRLLKKIRLK